MLIGRAPYYDESEYLVFQRIARGRYSFPDDALIDADAKSAVKAFLTQKATERLGAPTTGGIEAVRAHAYFHPINWQTLDDSPSPLARYYAASSGAAASDGEQPDELRPTGSDLDAS